MKNLVERIVLLEEHVTIDEIITDYIESGIRGNPDRTGESQEGYFKVKEDTLAKMEENLIKEMVKKYPDNKSVVTEKLGISRTTLWKKLK